MKFVKKLVSVMLAVMMVFSFAACNSGSTKVEFTEKKFVDALEDAFDTDVEESFIIEKNGVVSYFGESYPANTKYISYTLTGATSIDFYVFENNDDADAYFAARYETMKQMDDDYYDGFYNSGESGYYCAPKQSDWEMYCVYYYDNLVFEISVVVDTEREKAVDLLDALHLPHT